MGAIYKITNQINNKIYIGKTIREPQTRWKEHIQYSHQPNRYNTPLYQALRKYGPDYFTFEIIEDNLTDINELNEKEKYYINLYHSASHELGYNIAIGGDGGRTSSKLTQQQVNKIIDILSDENNLLSFNDIGQQFNISGSVIRAINQGISWYLPNISYPIRKYDVTGLSLTRKQYKDIVSDIQNSKLQLQEIAIKYNLSEQQMTSINQGRYCYKNHPYYVNIYNGTFPIRENTRIITPADDYIPIFYDVLFSKDSMAKIGLKHGVEGNTIQCIISGKRRKELTKNFLVPMRKHIKENQEIFKQLYPNYKGDDAQ